MAYYYVKSGGTAVGADIDTDDGIYTSAKTGTWASAFSAASEYFDSVPEALVASFGSPVDGDFVLVSDLHDKTEAGPGGLQVNFGGTAGGTGLRMISVDDADVEAYKPGASDVMTNASNDYTFDKNGFIAGISLGTGDDFFQVRSTCRFWRLQDMTVILEGSADNAFKQNQDGSSVLLTNVDVNVPNAGAHLHETMNGGSVFVWKGGTLTGTAPTALVSSAGVGGNGGGFLLFDGVDLSIYQGALALFGVAGTCDNLMWIYTNCKLHASATLGTINAPQQRIEVYGGWGGSDQHGFAIKDYAGEATHDDAVYVTGDEAWYEGSVISSIKIVTTANCSHVFPFIVEMPAQYVDLGDSGSDVLSLECVSATSGLQSNDVAAFIVYPDAASAVTPNWVTSGKTVGTGNYGIDPLSTSGNALDAGALGAGDWTGEPGSPNFYKLESDTTVDPGEATGVSIRIEVYKPSLTIYISPQIRTA